MIWIVAPLHIISALALEQMRFSAEWVDALRYLTWATLAVSSFIFLVRPFFRRVSDAQVAQTQYAGEGIRAKIRSTQGQIFVGLWVMISNIEDELPRSEMLQMLSTADVCVNPDRANEMNDKSTMNKIMEYMALEKPIVQFDLTEGRFSAQEASAYAAPNDAPDFAEKILELLADPGRRTAMGQAGKRRVEGELSWNHEVPKLLAAYEDVFES